MNLSRHNGETESDIGRASVSFTGGMQCNTDSKNDVAVTDTLWKRNATGARLKPKQADFNVIPFKLSKGCLTLVYIFVGISTGSFFFNWPPVKEMYIRSGTYDWLCSLENKLETSVNLAEPLRCEEKLQRINSLMPGAVASLFVFAFFGGILVDHAGPKISAFIALVLQISGWLLLSFCNKNLRLYPVANMLIGFANYPMYFALLNISNLFPQQRGIIMATVATASSFSFVGPSGFSILLSLGISLKNICLGYTTLLLFCLAIVIILFPSRCFTNTQPSVTDSCETLIPGDSPCDSQLSQSHLLLYAPNPKSSIGGEAKSSGSISSLPGINTSGSFRNDMSSFVSIGPGYKLSDSFRPSRALPKKYGSWSKPLGYSQATTTVGSLWLGENHLPNEESDAIGCQLGNTHTSSVLRLFCLMRSWLYLPLFPIGATSILCATFFVNSSSTQIGFSLGMFATMNPFSFLPGILLGWVADKFGPVFVMVVMNSFGLLQFGLLLLAVFFPGLNYLTAGVSFIVVSFFLTQFYCYILMTFPPENFGTLAGVVIMCSGMVSLVVTPMCDFSSFESNFVPMNGLCLALTIMNYIFIYCLWRAQLHNQTQNSRNTAFIRIDTSAATDYIRVNPKINETQTNLKIKEDPQISARSEIQETNFQ